MKKTKRILALVGAILLVSIYVLTLVGAVTHSKYSDALFKASLYSTFVVPVMLYGYILVYRLVKKHSPSDTPDK